MAGKRKSSAVDVSRRNDVALVTLNRPDAKNALDAAFVAELDGALQTLDTDPRVRAIVLLGAGPSFCAGEDFRSIRTRADAQAVAHLLAS